MCWAFAQSIYFSMPQASWIILIRATDCFNRMTRHIQHLADALNLSVRHRMVQFCALK